MAGSVVAFGANWAEDDVVRLVRGGRTLTEHATSHPPCPNCKSGAVEPVLADFYARTSKKS